MISLLQTGVQTGVISAAGAVLTIGGLLLTAAWYRYLVR